MTNSDSFRRTLETPCTALEKSPTVRYFMGINSTTFERGYRHDTRIFDKHQVDSMQNPGRVYLIADPVFVECGNRGFLFSKKRAARHAMLLAREHGGEPLVVQCCPSPDGLRHAPQVKGGYYQEGGSISVLRIFRLALFLRISKLDLCCLLQQVKPVGRY